MCNVVVFPNMQSAAGRRRGTDPSRRRFLATTSLALLGARVQAQGSIAPGEPIIDIHQHLNYSGRTDEALLAHQRAMGVTMTVLLPAGRSLNRRSTHAGAANGLQVGALGNEACWRFSTRRRDSYRFAANEVPDIPETRTEIERYLQRGAVMIAEQKFGIDCDSPEMQRLYSLAQDRGVPVLMHWQFEMYSYGFERFHRMLGKFPRVNFIGHAQTWWANIDKNHADQKVLYPRGPVAAGGLTDRYLADYPNMFGDLSAGSGLNALTRDEAFTRGFLARHQDKLLFGSDCNDGEGTGAKCQGSQTIAAIRRLSPDAAITRKLLHANAKKLLRL